VVRAVPRGGANARGAVGAVPLEGRLVPRRRRGDTTANALAFTRDIGIGYPSVSDASYSIVQDFSRVASVGYTPTTVVIDRTGHIAGLVIGKISYQSMTTILNDAAASP